MRPVFVVSVLPLLLALSPALAEPQAGLGTPLAALTVPGLTPPEDVAITTTTEEPTTSGYIRMDAESASSPEFEFALFRPVFGQDMVAAISLAEEFGQISVGPSFSFGAFELTPLVGVGFDMKAAETSNVDAMIYSALTLPKIYGEFWLFGSWQAPFVADPVFSVYSQNFLLYQMSDNVGLGPQAEATLCVHGCTGDPEGVLSVPIGGRANFTIGDNEVGMFLGYNSQIPSSQDGLIGRLTLIRSF